jgi:hypothetical protein
MVCASRVDPAGWADLVLVALPLFVAPDLAQHASRDREALDGWAPQHGGRPIG